MFDPGTKVILLASSHRGSTGPKKGSIGFFVQPHGSGTLEFDSEKNIFFYTAEIVFYRFGFEQSERSEKKVVIVALPNINKNYTDISGQVTKLSRRIQSGKDELWNNVRQANDFSQRVPVVMVAPAGACGVKLQDCNKNEFRAWLDAVTQSQVIAQWVSNVITNHHLEKSHHPGLNVDSVLWLREVMTSKSVRDALIKEGNKEVFRSAVETIRLALCVTTKNTISSEIDYFSHLLQINPSYRLFGSLGPRKEGIIASIYHYFFRPQYLKRVVAVLGPICSPTKEQLGEPEAVRGCLLELSACLERTGKVDGKKAMSVGQ